MGEARCLPASEWHEWVSHYQHFPPAEIVVPRLLATLCSMVASFAGAKNCGPEKFLPQMEAEARSEDEARKRIRAAKLEALRTTRKPRKRR